MQNLSRKIMLTIDLGTDYIPSILSMVQAFTRVYADGGKAALRFQLVAEELLTCLCRMEGGIPIQLCMREEGSFLCLELEFLAHNVELYGLNLANIYQTRLPAEVPDNLNLLLVARNVDGMEVSVRQGKNCRIKAYVQRPFPSFQPAPASWQAGDRLHSSQNQNHWILALGMAGIRFPQLQKILYFRCPQALLADSAAGRVHIFCCVDEADMPAGFLLWWKNGSSVIFNGPYLVGEGSDGKITEQILELFIQQMGKEDISYIIAEEKQLTGAARLFDQTGTIYYRLMREDNGGNLWAGPQLAERLRPFLAAMELERNLLPAYGEIAEARTLLTAQVNSFWHRIDMEPAIVGKDFSAVLQAHMASFQKRKWDMVTVSIALDRMDQVLAAELFLQQGFEIWYFIPGAHGDKVVLKHES